MFAKIILHLNSEFKFFVIKIYNFILKKIFKKHIPTVHKNLICYATNMLQVVYATHVSIYFYIVHTFMTGFQLSGD